MGRGARGSYELGVWSPDFARAAGRRAAARSYKAFVPDKIAREDFTLASATAALCERAAGAVRELNAGAPSLTSLEGLARQLLRSEALASSRIEGLGISHRKLAEAQLEGQGDHRALEVLANMRAMEEAVRIGERATAITPEEIRSLHRELAIVPPLDRIAGQFREEQGWIGGATPADADYVGPPHKYVRSLVADICGFINRDDISPIAQAAIAHAQFELVHPFADGNGRVGRCLIHVIFRRRGIGTTYVPPVSLVLGANKDAYIAGIQNFAADRVDDWVAQFARAVEVATDKAEDFSHEVAKLQDEWRRRLGPVRSDAAALRIIDDLPSFPFITSAIVQERTGRSDVAALRALAQLEKAGVLTRHQHRRKGDSWEAKELFESLGKFEHAVKAP